MLRQDIFKWTLIISIVFHLIVVLGISFVMPTQNDQIVIGPPLKITLVTHVSEIEFDDAQILAQANSDGAEEVNTNIANQLLNNQINESVREQKRLQESEHFIGSQSNNSLKNAQNTQKETDTNQNLNRDQLAQNINLAYLNSQAQPREKYISAKSKESEYAAYIEKWRLLVERVGNLNYPEAARQQKLEGTLVLDVAILSDGTISEISVLKSSGHKVLDDAAERIAHIASPFDRFPDAILSQFDILHIVLTWEFSQDTLSSNIDVK